jgi:hypothetical protein
VSADGLTWFFVAMVITKRTRPETTRHLFAGQFEGRKRATGAGSLRAG